MRKLFLLWLVAVLTEFGISAMPKVEHKEKNPEPRVVGVDQAHWWVKVNRMSREGKPAEEIVDFITRSRNSSTGCRVTLGPNACRLVQEVAFVQKE